MDGQRRLQLIKDILKHAKYRNGTETERNNIVSRLRVKGMTQDMFALAVQQLEQERHEEIQQKIQEEELEKAVREMHIAQFGDLTNDPRFHTVKFLDYKSLVAVCSADKGMLAFCRKNERLLWEYMTSRDVPDLYERILLQEPNYAEWKNLYKRVTQVSDGTAIYQLLGRVSIADIGRGTFYWDKFQSWIYRLDKLNHRIVYIYPSHVDGNSSNSGTAGRILKLTFPDMIREEIPWEKWMAEGPLLTYKKGYGNPEWFDNFFELRMVWDAQNMLFEVYAVQ